MVVNNNNNICNNNIKNNNGGWGMGFLFIFFHNNNTHLHSITKPNNNNNNKTTSLLASRTQSTLSICVLLLFTTLVLFTLSTFQPTSSTLLRHNYNNNISSSRRFLQHKAKYNKVSDTTTTTTTTTTHYALHGIGELYLRGSKAMSDLIVAHISEQSSPNEIRTFIRLLLHSGLLSRADLVFVFPSLLKSIQLGPLLRSECKSLLRLVQLGAQLGTHELGAGLTRYFRPVEEGVKESMWGRGRGFNSTSSSSYGSVVGFDSSELDPEDTLSGFLDHVPMDLRRWACYPMLLGRLRRHFKHVMLVDVRSTLILSDPFSRVRNRSSESVFIWSNSIPGVGGTRHGKRNSGKARGLEQKNQLNPGAVVGGSRGVRRFANVALTEIVRGSMEYKGKNRDSVSELSVVNQLVHSGHLLKSIKLMTPTESIPEAGSLTGFNSADTGSSFMGLSEYFSVVKRGSSEMEDVVMREICGSSKLYASVYRDC